MRFLLVLAAALLPFGMAKFPSRTAEDAPEPAAFQGERLEWLPPQSAWEAPVGTVDLLRIEPTDHLWTLEELSNWEVWSGAPAAGPLAAGVGIETPDQADVRFLADASALWIGARLTVPTGGVVAEVEEPGGRVWRDHAFEVLLQTAPEAVPVKLIVNANGILYAEGLADGGTAVAVGAFCAQPDAEPAHWQAVLGIPWASLGTNAEAGATIPAQLRYLMPGGRGFCAWSSAEDPRQWPRLDVAAAGAAAPEIRISEFFFPDSVPNAMEEVVALVRASNEGNSAARVLARLVDLRGQQQVMAQEIVGLLPGQTAEIALRARMQGDEPHPVQLLVAQLWGDPVQRRDLLSTHRLLTRRAPLELQLDRERIFFGDRELAGRLIAVFGPGAAEQTVGIELWDASHRIAWAAIRVAASSVHPFRINTAGLPAGHYQLVAKADDKVIATRKLRVEQAMELPERERIRLLTDWPQAALDAPRWPLYAGVSFPGGTLLDEEQVRVVDAGGREVPSQVEVLARWGPHGSIRWLGVHFIGEPQTDYHLEFGSAVRRTASPPQPVVVTKDSDGVRVDTGAARFELPFSGPLVSRIWNGNELVADNSQGMLVLTSQDGTVATESAASLELELEGPVQTIVKREGDLVTAEGRRLGRFVVRMRFCAGLGLVPVQHTLIMTESAAALQISELSLRVQPAMAGAWVAAFDLGQDSGGGNWMEIENANDLDQEYWMFQEVFPHHRRNESRFQVGRGAEILQRGESAGESAAVWAGNGAGIGITMPNLARLFPKELALGPQGLVARLWSSRGGRLLDYRTDAIADHVGDEWLDKRYPGGAAAFRKQSSNPASTARTHDLVLWVLAPGDLPMATAAATGAAAAQPPFVCQEPAWLRETLALGPLHPYDPQNFPRVEAFLEQFFAECLEGQARRFGDHGFLDFGAGPHTYDSARRLPGEEWPRLNYRYSNMDYGMRTSIWLAYARSGQRAYRNYAEALNRHFYDFKFSHLEGAGRPLGAELNGVGSEESMLYWTGAPGRVPGAGGHQAFDVENHLYQFFLTGDRMAHDVALRFGDYLLDHFDPAVLPDIGATSGNFRAYGCAAVLYEQTWNPAFARLVIGARDKLVDLRTTTGLVNQKYYGAFYKRGARAWGVLKDFQATGARIPEQALVKLSEWVVASQPHNSAGYQDHDSSFFQVAYSATGDLRFVDWINTRLMGLAFNYTTPEGELRGEPYEGTHSSNVIEAIGYGLDLIAANRDRVRPRPLFPVLDRAQNSWLALKKNDDQSVGLELLAGRNSDLNLLALADASRSDWQGGYTGPLEVDWRPDAPTLPFPSLQTGYARVRLPFEMLGGTYRMDGVSGWIAQDAGQAVLVAPQGLYYAADQVNAAPLWFLVPAGSAGTITVNRAAVLHRGGTTTPVAPGTPFSIEGSGAMEPVCLTTEAGTIFVRLDGGLPPVFARSPDALFLPPGVQNPEPLQPVSEEAAGTAFRLGPQPLRFPRGLPTGEGVFEFFDTRRGTLEFWFRPAWSSALLPEPKESQLLQTRNWHLSLKAGQAASMVGRKPEHLALDGSHLQWIVNPADTAAVHQRILHAVDLWQDRWHHIALAWDTDPDAGWVSELFVDGVPAMTWNRRGHMSRFLSGRRGENLAAWRPAPPGDTFSLPGSLDGWVKQIRVSDQPRYTQGFAPPAPGTLTPDDHTLLFIPLNGSLGAIAPRLPSDQAPPRAETR